MFDKEKFVPSAVIKVVGVGGGGGNAINTMIESGLAGVEFIAANTDVQALQSNLAPIKIQLGRELTKGLGAGANPDVGRDAALEDKAIIQEVLQGADMVFVTAGMGGGTGTGAAPIIAQVARELGALTVGVVTKPFNFEGKRRRHHGDSGIHALRASVDTLITIPNQRLLNIAPTTMSMLEGFKLADEILRNAVKGISDIINIPGRVNVDFADVKTIMSEMGMALMGIGAASGTNRAVEAARAAISSPLLEEVDIEGATGILINITGSSAMTLHEISEASTLIQEAAHEDANIIFGAVIDESMGDLLRVTVIATGFDQARIDLPESAHLNPMQHAPQQLGYQMQNQARPAMGAPQRQGNPYDLRNNAPQRPSVQPGMRQAVPSQSVHAHIQNSPARTAMDTVQRETMRAPTLPRYNTGHENLERRADLRAPQPQNHVAPAQTVTETKSEYEELTRWTMELANGVDSHSQDYKNMQDAGCPMPSERVIHSHVETTVNTVDSNPEAAFQLAQELADIAIDETDFETPAFMRRKDETIKNA